MDGEKVDIDCDEMVYKYFPFIQKGNELDSYCLYFWFRYRIGFIEEAKNQGLNEQETVDLFERKIKAFLSTK